VVTFEQARALVLKAADSRWNSRMGRLTVAPTGFESARYWRPRAVAQEELDGNADFLQMDEVVYLVDKQSGRVTATSYLVRQQEIDEMTPYPAA
jgi:hypothetical protein